MRAEGGVEPLGARETPALVERLAVRGRGERALLGGHLEDLLPEPAQLLGGVRAVEGDEIVERSGTRAGGARAEVRLEVGLELVEEDVELGIVELARRGEVGRIDDHGAAILHHGERTLEGFVRCVAVAGVLLARDTDARALQPVCVEGAQVVADARASRRRVARICTGEHAQ